MNLRENWGDRLWEGWREGKGERCYNYDLI